VALLATKKPHARVSDTASPQSTSSISRDPEELNLSPFFPSPESSKETGILTPRRSPPDLNTAYFAIGDVIDRGLVSTEKAQALLESFRCKAAQNFPFVIIPPHTTLDSVRRNTPFLFLTIIASLSVDNSPLQRQLGEEIRIQIHRRMFLGFESSLELLQGLLVHLAWYYYFIFPHKQQTILLSQLCVTLAYQLETNRNSVKKKRKVANHELHNYEREEFDTAKTRAMLGTFYLSSA
jgi:hypothetical protein